MGGCGSIQGRLVGSVRLHLEVARKNISKLSRFKEWQRLNAEEGGGESDDGKIQPE